MDDCAIAYRVIVLKPHTLVELKFYDAIKGPHCPFCLLMEKAQTRMLDHLLEDEVVMDPGFRDRFLNSSGLCSYHFDKLYNVVRNGGALGLGLELYLETLSGAILKQLGNQTESNLLARLRKRDMTLCKFLPAPASCYICNELVGQQERLLDTALNIVAEDKEIISRLGETICYTHLYLLLERGKRDRGEEKLLSSILSAFMTSLKDKRNFLHSKIKKYSYEFIDTALSTQERDAGSAISNALAGSSLLSILPSDVHRRVKNKRHWIQELVDALKC